MNAKEQEQMAKEIKMPRFEGPRNENEIKQYMYDKIYKKPAHQHCRHHLFCEREQMVSTVHPQDKYPLPGRERWVQIDKSKKMSLRDQEQLNQFHSYLKKDFYYRGIAQKKQLLQEGLLTSAEFQDDGVLKYVVNDSGIDDWVEQSKKFGEKCGKERLREEKAALEIEKKRA